MCAGAIVWSKLTRLVFGAFDEKAGSASTLYNIPQDPRLNHRVEIISGLEADRSAALLQAFFRKRREKTGAASPISGPGAGGDGVPYS